MLGSLTTACRAACFALVCALAAMPVNGQTPVPQPPPPPPPPVPAPAASVSIGPSPSFAPESPLPATPASPTPLATPTTPATPTSATPASAPAFPAANHAIRLQRARVGIVPGATVSLAVIGGVGALTARSSSPSVEAALDLSGRRLVLIARTAGTASVIVSDAGGGAANVDVLVAPAAGVVPSDVTIDLGGLVSPQFAIARANAEIARVAALQPGAKIDIHGLVLVGPFRPGDALDATARVKIDGAGAFVDANGSTSVHFKDATYPKLDPQVLLYSDDPERLDATADGVLYSGTFDATRPARMYVYHVSDAPNRKLYLALQTTAAARVQVLGYSAGPENAFGYVGHRSTLQYLLERGAQESIVLSIEADVPYLLPLTARAMRAGDLVASIFDLRLLEGEALHVSVVAASGDADPIDLVSDSELASDGHGRRGEFALADVPPLGLTFTAGAPEPAPFSIGAPVLANLRAGGRSLGGDYGVLREIALQLVNPGPAAQAVYFYEEPAGGSATTTLWFTGDAAPTEIACVRVPQNRYMIKAFSVAPGESRTVTGEYMTDGSSSFPLLFGLTATPPSPPPGPYSPDACTPRQPPPSSAPPSTVPPSSAPPSTASSSTPPSSTPPSSAPPSTAPSSTPSSAVPSSVPSALPT